MLRWKDYPTISKLKEMERVELEKPLHKEVVTAIESLREDEILILYDYSILPEKKDGTRYTPRGFMKYGPELKIRVIDEIPLKHFRKELERYNFHKPKRGIKWTNPDTRISTFFSLSNLIDGTKLYCYSKMTKDEKRKIRVGGAKIKERNRIKREAWVNVPSRSEERMHNVQFNPLPSVNGKDWYRLQCFCDCGERGYYGHLSKKYKNPESWICAHIVAGYLEAMEVFPQKDLDPLPPLFPVPTEEMIKFDNNLARTFVKEEYKRRLNKAEREVLLSREQGLRKNRFTFSPKKDWIERYSKC